jgi:hypothetical protein
VDDCERLRDEHWEVRLRAARALERRARTEPQPCLEDALTDPNAQVRYAAIRGISHHDPDRAVQLLRRLLKPGTVFRPRPAPPSIRKEAEDDLARLRRGEAVRDAPDLLG